MSELLRIANCESELRIGDAVFVHGLDGNGRLTWHPKGDPDAYWPNWLAEDLPDIGVWSLDYDAASLAWSSAAMPLLSRAANCLELFDVEGLGRRPLVFVTHSLGGLLAKQMLRHASDTGQDWLVAATKGVVFLATPHSGSRLASWVDKLGNYLPIRSNDVIRNLRDSDPALCNLNDWYRNHAAKFGIETKVFFEESKVRSFVAVVDRVAGNPGIPGVDCVPLDADHISICKPSSKNALVYKSVRKFVRNCLPVPHLAGAAIQGRP